MRVGFHVSIKKGVDKAIDRVIQLEINTFQMFTRSPRMWKHRELRDSEIDSFKEKLSNQDIWPVFSHMPYISNLSSPNDDIYNKSIKTLEVEISRSQVLDLPFIVTHLGSHLGSGIEKGLTRIIQALKKTLKKTDTNIMILLENTSGKKNEVGSSFEELKFIINEVDDDRIGICLDTCHTFTRGYDIKTTKGLQKTLKNFNENIGMKSLKLVHLNDSIGELGSKIDRHTHIGLGKIGEMGFKNILNSDLKKFPLVMETPMDEIRTDSDNLSKVFELAK
jgi:deoxyribonuclease-4